MDGYRCNSVMGPMGETLRFTKRDQDVLIHTVVEPIGVGRTPNNLYRLPRLPDRCVILLHCLTVVQYFDNTRILSAKNWKFTVRLQNELSGHITVLSLIKQRDVIRLARRAVLP